MFLDVERKSFAELEPLQWRITHYVGLAEVRYDGLGDLVYTRLVPWPYVKIWLFKRYYRLDQYRFNKKRLVTKQRVDLLRLLIAKKYEGQEEWSDLDLMTELYSMRWVMHPDQESQQERSRSTWSPLPILVSLNCPITSTG